MKSFQVVWQQLRGAANNRLARRSFGLALLAAIFIYFDPRSILKVLSDARWEIALPAIVAMACLHLLGATCWRALSREVSGTGISWWQASKSYYAAQTVGGLTPGNIGGDAYRVIALNSEGTSLMGAAVPIMIQRITSTLVLVCAGVLVAPVVGLNIQPSRDVIIAACLLIAFAGLFVWKATPWMPRNFVRLFEESSLSRKRLLRSLGIGTIFGLLFHAGALGLSLLLTWSLQPDASAFETLACLAVARLAIALPVSPSGLGFQEGALVVLFPQVGLSSHVALGVSVLGRLSLMLTMLVGLILLIRDPLAKDEDGAKQSPGRGSHLLGVD